MVPIEYLSPSPIECSISLDMPSLSGRSISGSNLLPFFFRNMVTRLLSSIGSNGFFM